MKTEQPILVIGSIALDDVETPFGKRESSLGGSAIFFSLAAAYFTPVRIVGVAGTDFPDSALQLLSDHKIDTRGLEIAEGKTFRWGGCYHQDINYRDTLYTDLNVFADFQPKIPPTYRNTPYLFLGNIQPQLQLEVLATMHKPKFVALDTMNLWINTTRAELVEVIARVDLIMINDSELRELTGELNLLQGLEKLHHMGPSIAIIKQGEHGAYLSYRNRLFYAPVHPVRQPTDPTGAGDSFAGGFMGYLAQCDRISFGTMKKAMLYGAIMGSLLVEHFSVDGLIRLEPSIVEERYRTLRKIVAL